MYKAFYRWTPDGINYGVHGEHTSSIGFEVVECWMDSYEAACDLANRLNAQQ